MSVLLFLQPFQKVSKNDLISREVMLCPLTLGIKNRLAKHILLRRFKIKLDFLRNLSGVNMQCFLVYSSGFSVPLKY